MGGMGRRTFARLSRLEPTETVTMAKSAETPALSAAAMSAKDVNCIVVDWEVSRDCSEVDQKSID
jgi:hypothetical protein